MLWGVGTAFGDPVGMSAGADDRRQPRHRHLRPRRTGRLHRAAAYVYDAGDWDKTLQLVDESTVYGPTGAVFATDEGAIAQADVVLRYTAGNLYVNDKPTSATVG